jgi:signal transduction protein with GAF and PtsI domain
MADISALLD